MQDTATRSFISCCFRLAFTSTDIIFHKFLGLHSTLYEKNIFQQIHSVKNPIPYHRSSSFTQSRRLNGILLLNHDANSNKSSFDMKQSVVSIGSQYTLGFFQIAVRESEISLRGDFFYRLKGTWRGVILTIRTFFKDKNSFLWMLSID